MKVAMGLQSLNLRGEYMYIVSKCLLGENCKYNGGNNFNQEVVDFLKNRKFIGLCPEEEGGLETPRIPAEIKDNRVINKEGKDVTENFQKGALFSLKQALEKSKGEGESIEGAILKAKSPSCGWGKIYDGSFSGRLISGNGIFAELLKNNNIKVITEEEFKKEI